MQAITFHGPQDFRFQETKAPELESDSDVIVGVIRSAICGSDLHLWHGSLPVADRGFVVGHECVGVAEEVGSGVQTIAKGDRVFVSCTLGCGTCVYCRQGLYSGCKVTTAGGTRSNIIGFSAAFSGVQAERVRVPFADANVFRLPDGVSDEQALFLTDILPTAEMVTQFAEVKPGDRVVILGCGPVGALAQRCAQIHGAARVIAVDLEDARLARARELGCDVVNPDKENLAERVLELTGGEGADAAIEAVGRPELIASAALLVRPGGIIAVAGVNVAPVELPWAPYMMRNLSLRAGLVNPQCHVGPLLSLIESGRLDPTEIITHRMPLSEGLAGYEMFAERRDGVLKVVLES
jgi:2-desacetyl-2-hydroxyethyl bacteriochlorophyllide A dehydrogenase